MNTNQLKKFAQDARRKLLAQVGARLEYVQTAQSAELLERSAQIAKLREALLHTKPELLVEKVAYTWFNRLVALRFLDANDYQPLGLRVVSPQAGHTLPQLLAAAKIGQLPEDLRVDRNRLNDLFDGRMPAANPQNEAYRLLLTAACNHLHETFPFLFERIDDYSELLLPEDLTSEFSIVHDVVEGMPAEDCQAVEIIGWLYQFYISEKKDAVYASGEKFKKEDIPAATQLFTPRWIVEYLVQNSLGKLWLNSRPHSRLQGHMPYYIPSADGHTRLRVERPEDIRLLDPACGSGHILVYAFDLLTRIYEEEGYAPSEIPALILQHNLYGLEIDERAAQLAGLALLLKARQYHRRAFRSELRPQITWLKPLTLNETEIRNGLEDLNLPGFADLMGDMRLVQQADVFGSLIQPQSSPALLENARTELERGGGANLFAAPLLGQLHEALDVLSALQQSFHCVVANPPYLGSGNMNNTLNDWVKENYPDSKADLMTCFMEKSEPWLCDDGFLAMINLPSWMFLSSFESFRKDLLQTFQVESLLQLGRGIFGSDFGSVAFCLRKTEKEKGIGVYRRLFEEHVQVRSVETIKNLFLDKNYGYFNASQQDFVKIPGSPVGYWLTEKLLSLFNLGTIDSKYELSNCIQPGDALEFLRLWTEINLSSFSKDWKLVSKGGAYRKWYGNIEYCLNYGEKGEFLLRNPKSTLRGVDKYFNEGFVWTRVSSGKPSFRAWPAEYLVTDAGPILYSNDFGLLGFLNSNLSEKLLTILSPTLNYQIGYIGSLPFIKSGYKEIVKNCILISTNEWNSKETSKNFLKNEIFRRKGFDDINIEEAYDLFRQYWTNKFFQLHHNEEEINRQFIETYALQNELAPEVPLDEITILQEETCIKDGKLIFDAKEVFSQFLSYFTGCLLGRYSLDREGLILANQGETLQDYLDKVGKPAEEVQFLPDVDNIVPVLDDAWFEDDIVGRFHQFLRVTFGEKNFAKNLAFVEECLGKDVRTYFVRDFYNDHIKRYKKRPIYWMFSSPGGAFNALVYLHRYTPDTLNQLLNRYLRAFREKLRTRREHLEQLQATGSPAERTKALREKEKIDRDLLDLLAYERDILFPLATERIGLDLDDGVLVNYNKLGRAVKEVAGLNDKKAKAKVRAFDWIDTSTIRD